MLGLYKDFGAYKNGRPARVVTTDAGLNDYINDLSFFPGFGEGGEIIFPLYFIFSGVFFSPGFGGAAAGFISTITAGTISTRAGAG